MLGLRSHRRSCQKLKSVALSSPERKATCEACQGMHRAHTCREPRGIAWEEEKGKKRSYEEVANFNKAWKWFRDLDMQEVTTIDNQEIKGCWQKLKRFRKCELENDVEHRNLLFALREQYNAFV